MRATAILLSVAAIASASAQPRVDGPVSQDDVRSITAAIRAATPDRIVFIRATPSADRVGVQTESGPDAGCHYLVERNNGTWQVAAKNCWTHTRPAIDSSAFGGPAVDAHISSEDVRQICAAVARVTREPIRSIDGAISDKDVRGSIAQDSTLFSEGTTKHIKTYERTDLVDVDVGKSGDVTGKVYYVQKFGKTWKVIGKGDWIR